MNMTSRKMRTTTVDQILESNVRRRHSTKRKYSHSNDHDNCTALYTADDRRSFTPSPSYNTKRSLLPTPVRNRAEQIPNAASIGEQLGVSAFSSSNSHRSPQHRSSSLESLEDEAAYLQEPMLTVKGTPRNDKTNQNYSSKVEFWSKNTVKRKRRTSVSALCPYPDLLDTARHLRNNITVGSRRKILFGTKYTQVFSGRTAANFLLQYICDDPNDNHGAEDIGTWMMKEQFIVPVDGKAKTGGSGKSGQSFSSSTQALYRFNDAMLSPYHLHVIIHHATGLLGKRNDGSSYPFAIIEASDQIGSTRVLSNTLTPHWNEKFLFGLYDYNETGGNDYTNDSNDNSGGSSNSNNASSNSARRLHSNSIDSTADEMVGMALRIRVWTEKKPFLNQHPKAFLGNVNIPWKKVPFIKNTDRNGWSRHIPKPMTIALQKRSAKSHVSGSITITAYITRYNYSSYLKTRCHSSPVIESDPTYQRNDIAQALDGKILIPKTKREMQKNRRSQLRNRTNNNNNKSATTVYEQKAREQVDTALDVADFILWDLVIDLESLNDIDYRGIAADLKVASALLLPGMSWKQRVIAHIRSPSKDWLMLPSGWIRRSQSVFLHDEDERQKHTRVTSSSSTRSSSSSHSSTSSSLSSSNSNIPISPQLEQSSPNIIRVNELTSDDIENNILHLRVHQDNTWSLNKNANAGRELGRTAEFTLSSLPKILSPPGSSTPLVSPPAYIEYPMTAYTSMAKQRRISNGNIRAAIYLVPSKLKQEDETLASLLINERVGLHNVLIYNEKGMNSITNNSAKNSSTFSDTNDNSGGSRVFSALPSLSSMSVLPSLSSKERGEKLNNVEKKTTNLISSSLDKSTSTVTTKAVPADFFLHAVKYNKVIPRTLSKQHIILDTTLRIPYQLLHHYLISDNSMFLCMSLVRDGCTSISVGKWSQVQYDYMLHDDDESNSRDRVRSGSNSVTPVQKQQTIKDRKSPVLISRISINSDLNFSSDSESDKEESSNQNNQPKTLRKKTGKRRRSRSLADQNEKEKHLIITDRIGIGQRASSKSMGSSESNLSGLAAAASNIRNDESRFHNKNDSEMTYARRLSWRDKIDGSERTEIQVIRKYTNNSCIVDMNRSGSGIYSKGIWYRLSFDSDRKGVTKLTMTLSKSIPKSTLNILKNERHNMCKLLQVVVAQAGVEKIEKSSKGSSGGKALSFTDFREMSYLQSFTLVLLIVALVGVAIIRSGYGHSIFVDYYNKR